jgi:hypothetical protein
LILSPPPLQVSDISSRSWTSWFDDLYRFVTVTENEVSSITVQDFFADGSFIPGLFVVVGDDGKLSTTTVDAQSIKFTDLEDVPPDYAGFANFFTRVNIDGTGLVFSTVSLFELADVTITLPAAGDLLFFDGARWINTTIGLNDLNDVEIVAPNVGDVLIFNGLSWVSQAFSGSGRFPVVTGDTPPVLVYVEDGNLVFADG